MDDAPWALFLHTGDEAAHPLIERQGEPFEVWAMTGDRLLELTPITVVSNLQRESLPAATNCAVLSLEP
jgi:hypothetical protein